MIHSIRKITGKSLSTAAMAAAFIGLLALQSTPAQANNCTAVCEFMHECLVLGNQDPSRANELRKIQRQKRRFISNCVKGCEANKAAALGCYQQHGPTANAQACIAGGQCLYPYVQKK